MSARSRIARIAELLESEYHTPDLGNKSDPIEELVFILLSAKTDEAKYFEAFRNLKDTFASWEDLCTASQDKIASVIQRAGMARRRAHLIQSALIFITKRYGGLDLSSLRRMSGRRAEKELTAIPGIGPKAARCILLYCFGRQVLPVDIHTYRLAVRLGILSRTVSYEQSHEILHLVIPWNLRRKFHINAVAHGRKRCKPTHPLCDDCALSRFCFVPQARREPKIRVRALPLAMDLFSGAGGMSQGFKQGGFEIVQAIEKDPRAADTYRRNHKQTDLIVGDVCELDPLIIARRLALRRSDLTAIIGGPPCQGFSESNRRTRALENPQNALYRQFFRYVALLRPVWFVFENVVGLRTLASGTVLDAIVTEARALGYCTEWWELNSVHYGVPQARRRIFVLGNRIGASIELPLPTHGLQDRPVITTREAISDLPVLSVGEKRGTAPYKAAAPLSAYQKLMRNGHIRVNGNLVSNNSPLVRKRYRYIKQGQNWEAIPKELMGNYFDTSRCHTGIYYRLKWSEPARVIGNFRKNMLIHPSQHRGLSVREAARLQSFPDEYTFVGSIGFQQQQVADAVPPLLAQAVAEALSRRACDPHGYRPE